MSAATERAGLGAIAMGLQQGLTINRAVQVAVWVRQWNGTRYVVQQIVKDVTLQNKGLGCLIGLRFAQIAATISGATDYSVDADNCTIVWNTNAEDGDPGVPPADAPNPEDFGDPENTPAGWEWRGRNKKPGGREGAYHNPETGESMHDDRTHAAPKLGHWTYTDKSGKRWDNFGNGWVPQKRR